MCVCVCVCVCVRVLSRGRSSPGTARNEVPPEPAEPSHLQLQLTWDFARARVISTAPCTGTHTFEIFGMLLARDYEALAERFVDLRGERTQNN